MILTALTLLIINCVCRTSLSRSNTALLVERSAYHDQLTKILECVKNDDQIQEIRKISSEAENARKCNLEKSNKSTASRVVRYAAKKVPLPHPSPTRQGDLCIKSKEKKDLTKNRINNIIIQENKHTKDSETERSWKCETL